MEKLKSTIEKKEQTILSLEQVIRQYKENNAQLLDEKGKLEKKLSILNQQKFNDELNYENLIRKYKQDLEQKMIQLEQQQVKENDHGLTILKLKGELEEPHQLELQHKNNQIEELNRSIIQLKHKCKLQEERLQQILQSQANEVQQLREKYQQDIGNQNLQLKQFKELNALNQKDQEQIRDLLNEKEQQLKDISQKDKQIRELRVQLEKEKISKDQNIQLLTQQLEQDRIQKRKIETQNEELEQALQNIRMTMKDKNNQNIDISGLRQNDQDINELQGRLMEYMKLFEDEKDQKRKLTNKLNDIIQQNKQEKLENDKIYENRIKDLQQQLKEEKQIRQNQSIKIKELYAIIEQLKHENHILTENNLKVDDRQRELDSKERKILDKELQLAEREANLPSDKPLHELAYENQKLKTKYKTCKTKLKSANQKILSLLTKYKEIDLKQPDQYKKAVEKVIYRDESYKGYYNLPENANILQDPYQKEMLDDVSQRLREDVYLQKKNLEHLDYQIDGRDPLQSRQISCLFGSQTTGSVELSLGDTRVFANTNGSISQPNPVRPAEGFLRFKVDIQLLRDQNNHNPQKYSMEIEKYIEKVIKGSKALDPESLCIQQGKSVWSIEVNAVVINNDGNLIDAAYLCTLMSLLHFRKPQIQGSRVLKEKDQRLVPLSIHHIPLSLTYSIVEIEDKSFILYDPQQEEENVQTGRITFSVNVYNDICHVHKPGGSPIPVDIIFRLTEVTLEKAKPFTQQLRQFLEQKDNFIERGEKIKIYDFEYIKKQQQQMEQE